MSYAFKNFSLQIRDVIGRNEISEVICIRFSRLRPVACGNFASRVAGNYPGNTQDDEFHQRLAGWSATRVYGGIIPTDDHRRRRQSTAATLEIDSRKEVERRFGKVNVRGLVRIRSGFVADGAVQGDEYHKNGIAPFILLHLAYDFLSHHPGAEQVEHEMTRVYIRDDHLPDSDFLAAGQAYGGGQFGITENFFHTDIRADFAAMCLKMFSESERDPIHPAFDEIVSHVLQDRGKKPTELSTTGVIGRCAEEGGERPEQGLGRFGFEG